MQSLITVWVSTTLVPFYYFWLGRVAFAFYIIWYKVMVRSGHLSKNFYMAFTDVLSTAFEGPTGAITESRCP